MGTSTAGIAHAAITAHLMELPMGYVRSGAKDHGRQNQIEGKLEKGQKVTIPVKGISMLPFIRGERDLVELTAPDRSRLQRDDIVLFRTHGRWIMHRILRMIPHPIPETILHLILRKIRKNRWIRAI